MGSGRITVLVENTAGGRGLLAEHGLAFWIELGDRKVLFDTGQSNVLLGNARRLGIRLEQVDAIVLSHGHYDHTGGLRGVLSKTGKAEVIAHPDIWAAKYARRAERERYVGIPFSQQELEALGASFTLSRDPVWISENIVTTGEIPMITEYEEIDPNVYAKVDGELIPDPILDDRALIVKTDVGLVVVLGCSHRGIINTLYHAREVTGVETIHTVVGGTHLISASEERILLTAAALKELGVKRVGASHCTGLPAAALLARELGDIFFYSNVGTSITIPTA